MHSWVPCSKYIGDFFGKLTSTRSFNYLISNWQLDIDAIINRADLILKDNSHSAKAKAKAKRNGNLICLHMSPNYYAWIINTKQFSKRTHFCCHFRLCEYTFRNSKPWIASPTLQMNKTNCKALNALRNGEITVWVYYQFRKATSALSWPF